MVVKPLKGITTSTKSDELENCLLKTKIPNELVLPNVGSAVWLANTVETVGFKLAI